jgi:hypothetical protein
VKRLLPRAGTYPLRRFRCAEPPPAGNIRRCPNLRGYGGKLERQVNDGRAVCVKEYLHTTNARVNAELRVRPRV